MNYSLFGRGFGMLNSSDEQDLNDPNSGSWHDPDQGPMGSVTSGASMGSAAGPYGAAIGAVAGLGKYELLDKPKYEAQKNLAVVKERTSGFTKQHGQMPNQPDPFANAFAFGSQGAKYGQGMDQAKQTGQLQDAYMRNLDAKTQLMQGQMRAPAQNMPSSFWGDYVKTPQEMGQNYGPGSQPSTPDDMFRRYGTGY